jgi:tetraacyldisaccharide 4'-kinase
MKQTAPKFWYENDGIFSTVLSPIASLYQIIHRIIQASNIPKQVNTPVICVGNLNIGGMGKTPTCISLFNILKNDSGYLSPMFLTRGYGGSVTEPERVNETGSARTWGDEPLLLAKHAPTIVTRNRYDGAKLAQKNNADIIIMDDGLQNNKLKKDISFMVINGAYGFGNKKTIPAGPLREPIDTGTNKVDAFILIGEDMHSTLSTLPENKPIFSGKISVSNKKTIKKNVKYIGFCGIAHPEKFKKTLESNNADIVDFISFPDHHQFSKGDLKKLISLAKKKDATLITTEKDHVRISDQSIKDQIQVLPITLSFSNAEKNRIRLFIEKRLQSNA